jgi:phosphinothricin acetyltransferase
MTVTSAPATIAIRAMEATDWPQVNSIYAEGIATRLATLETAVPAWEKWDQSHAPECRLVALWEDDIVGWAALTPVSGRCVYRGVAEESIYIAQRARGQGVGKKLMHALITASENAGYWTLQAGILSQNTASLALHSACGFRTVGYRERIGQLDGVWKDIILMERRSSVVGV